jgi:hypothetical protein
MADKPQEAFIREMQEKMDRKVKENEMAVIEYWQGQIGKILAMKPDGIASLQMQIKKIYDMMDNRVRILKRG